MPFPFRFLCELLSKLEQVATRDPHLLLKALNQKYDAEIYAWFDAHRVLVDAPDTDCVALLSALLPERRTDRVYSLQPPSLTKFLGRCFSLGSSRLLLLQRWKTPGGGDLGQCVERILKEAPFPFHFQGAVTIEEIDTVLNQIATRSRWSGPQIRGKRNRSTPIDVESLLSSIYHRLTPNEAKWFTRMVLKNYAPVAIPGSSVLRSCHHLLPGVMKVHDSFESAITFLRSPKLNWASSMPAPNEARRQKARIASHVVPHCGVKIGRPFFLKAWSVKHAAKLAHGKIMSLERKYDGEYCQIHVDMSKPGNEIQIFSKSGKDSTIDRRSVHAVIKESLRIGEYNCRFTDQCILEGELLVWSDRDQTILDFHKLRKHLDRSGVFLGNAQDSQPHPWEHLMIVFFDVMLVDDKPFLHQPYHQRRKALEELVTVSPGRADLATSQTLDFSSRDAPQELLEALAFAFAQRWEGYVMKSFDDPYVNFESQNDGEFCSCWIKLKKDKIPGLGDTAEFAVIGASYNAQEAANLGVPDLPWTTFYIGCLQNKIDVLYSGSKPCFIVLDHFNAGISKQDMKRLCDRGRFSALNKCSPRVQNAFHFNTETRAYQTMDVVFTEPVMFEVKGTGFEKQYNSDYFILRFPRAVKIHWERRFHEAIGFDELQDMARTAMNAPEGDFDDDVAMWIKQLRDSEQRGQGELCWTGDSIETGSDADTSPSISAGAPSSPERNKTPNSIAFVRMDTTEMLPTERRLANGEVTLRPAMENTVQRRQGTPAMPSSSSSSISPGPRPFPQDEMGNLTSFRKRTREGSDTENTPPPKRQCKSDLSILAESPKSKADIPSPQHRRPALNSIENSSTPHAAASFDAPSLDTAVPGFTLVAKHSASDKKIPPQKSRAAELGSSFCETAASEAASSTISQSISQALTDINSQPASQARPFHKATPSSPISNSSNINSPASPTTTDHPTHKHPPSSPPPASLPQTPPPPSFASPHTLTALSPCIHHMPYLTSNLLRHATLIAPSRLLSLALSDTNPFPASPTSSWRDNTVVLLVESHRHAPTAKFLERMLPLVGVAWVGECQVWDWRVAEVRKGREGRKWFLGWVRRAGDGVEIVWRGGGRSRAR